MRMAFGRQRYELSKELQDLRVDVAVFGDTSENSWGTLGTLFQITTFIEPTANWAEKGELPLQLEKASPTFM
jgi:hypothetical protein